MREPIRIHLFHDVLCPTCAVVEHRLRALRDGLGGAVEVTLRPFPLRLQERRFEGRDLARLLSQVRRAAREPEGAWITPDAYLSSDPPATSLPALLAAEASREMGLPAQEAFVGRMRRALFRDGLNVSRRDVLFELAASADLDLARFATALDAPATLEAVMASYLDARQRGVRSIPAVAVEGEWLITGVRTRWDYQSLLAHWLKKRPLAAGERVLH